MMVDLRDEKNQLTPFGVCLREIRTQKKLLLYDMARALGVGSAELCSYEVGKKRIPPGLFGRIINTYKLTSKEKQNLFLSIIKTDMEEQ